MKVHAIVEDVESARRAIEAGATVVQLAVEAPTAEVVRRGRGLRDLGATFVVVGDVDAALELGADGVHLERQDAAPARGRGLLVGRTVASLGEAVACDADYLYGEPSLALAELAAISSAVSIPLVAGDAANAVECIRAGAAGIAVPGDAVSPALRRAVDEALAAR